MNNSSAQIPATSPSEWQIYIQNNEAEFIKVVLKRLGIIIPSHNKEFNHTITNACHIFKCDPGDYLHRITCCADNSPLLEHLVSDITVGETYFFRDKHQMNLLKNQILPKIIKNKREQKKLSLRVWSAGCASGEEIYTIAIMLDQLLSDVKKWKLNLLGTDINTTGLQKAKLGRYNKWSMRSISDYYKQQYFTEQDNKYTLSSKITDMVDFSYLNLNDNTYPSLLNGTNSQDLIICRNVLIYLNGESITRLMKKISLSLADGGTLLLGASDPVNLKGTNLVFHYHDGMVFSRQDAKDPTPAVHELPLYSDTPVPQPLIPIEINKSRVNIKGSDETDPVLLLNLKAQEAANRGQLESAVNYCEKSLALDPMSKNTYFILGLTLFELNRLQEAETAFRKILYLDHKFVEGHFHLGLLLLKRKQYKDGLKSLQNALTIVNMNEATEIVPGSQGLSYERFAEILKAEIELYVVAGSREK